MLYSLPSICLLPFSLLLPSHSSLAASAQLTVTPLLDILFQNNSGVHNIVEQSVIWLYCAANSANATITWTKDGVTLVNDPAHIRIRSSSSGMSTTSSLVIDNFQSPDNGSYECQAKDGMMTASSSTLSLTGGWGCEPTFEITDTLFLTNMWSGSWFVSGQVYALCLLHSGTSVKCHELTCIQAVEMLTHSSSRLMSCELSQLDT